MKLKLDSYQIISKFINVNPNRANKIIISLLMEIEKDTKNNGFFRLNKKFYKDMGMFID